MSNINYIELNDPVILKTITNFTDGQNTTDLIFLLNENGGDSHIKNSVTVALAIAACAFLLSCYSCCGFNRFSTRTRNGTTIQYQRSTLSRRSGRSFIFSRQNNNNDQNEVIDSNQDRTNSSEQPDVIRRYDLDVESLPSYTLVSGLPTYDDALEQFRKAGIIITHPSVIKIFEDGQTKSTENIDNAADNISINSCTCGASSTGTIPSTATTTTTITPVIELSPEQLQILSQKRLSLQIALNSNVRRSSQGRIDLCREVNRSNLLRSHDIPQIHRSTSSLGNERLPLPQRLRILQHRGSLT